MKHFLLIIVFICSGLLAFAQSGIIRGKVFDAFNNQPIEFATIVVQNTNSGAGTDAEGNYLVEGLKPGLYNIVVSSIGYKTKTVFEIQVSSAKEAQVDVPLESIVKELDEVTVNSDAFNKSEESPVSLRTIGVNEIQRNPGGNRDISKVVQSFPGVGQNVAYRNDIIIRGGAPNENRFYLDEIEVPNINHFQTQGGSGGPVGMINVDFIKDVEFYSGAFPANKGNAVSSLFEFRQKDGRNDHLGLSATLGSSDLGLTLEGPIGNKSTFIFSVRRSYLQFLFKALALPFLPTYNDYQFKYKFKFDTKNELAIISLGALDNFKLNLGADSTDQQKYILGNIPTNNQWNYTIGAVYKHFGKNNFITGVVSRNMLNNEAEKYYQNDDSNPDNLVLNYKSQEIENKFRLENNFYKKGLKVNYGAGYEFVKYNNSTFNEQADPEGNIYTIDFTSEIKFSKYALFGQLTYPFFERRLVLSAGLRTDFNNYSAEMSNPLKQLSPRFSATYNINEAFNFNFSTGIYYQLPPYTVLGYRDNNENLVNKQNGVTYFSCKHLVAGFEYYTQNNGRISIEGFYKYYDQYPFILEDSISLANLGADFGVVGNTAVNSTSQGRSYGLELLLQQKLFKGFYGLTAITFVRSEFKDKNEVYVPSSWDSRIIVSLTAGKKFGKNWELGLKWRFSGGSPYTPYDIPLSSLIPVWNVNGQGLPDYDYLNTQRLPAFHQLDGRIDKKWFFNKFNLNLYLDVQNIYAFDTTLPDYLDVRRDADGNPLVDPANPGSYQTYLLENTTGTVLPSIGVIFEL
ncbi:MAG: TonB-dependent receptor [Chitinophagaceae bacterium]|nr:TonB-dependent receptor [Chitinophagaceae bacterium]